MSTSNGEVKKMATKLHKQFAHPSSVKLIKLLRDAKLSDEKLELEIKNVSEKCEACCKYRKPVPRPIVSMPLSSKFNDVIAMDLKFWKNNLYFLVIVDLATRYCSAAVINDKKPKTILKALFLCWVSKFGAPNQILSDNGCEFNNVEMRQFGETFNVKIMTTAAESPWSNGTCERLNAIIGDMVSKLVKDTTCDVSMALAWAVSARNALSNFSGFSPNHLVFGFNPAIPDIFVSDLPALEEVNASEIVRANLNAMHIARQEFVKQESSERVKRALRSNVRSSPVENLVNGDNVYYKRNDSKEWRGPGVVIGRDGKQVLVKHGGTYIRVHTCRLTRVPEKEVENEREENNVIEDEVPELHLNSSSHVCEDRTDIVENTTVTEENTENYASDSSHEDSLSISDDRHRFNTSELNTTSQENSVISSVNKDFKVGNRIEGVDPSSGESIVGRIVSRAGKSTGKYKNCFNVKKDSDGSIDWINLDQLDGLKNVPDNVEMLVMYNSEEVCVAKEKEIQNWRQNDVYKEVEDEGQVTVSVRWIITEKLKEGETVTKARLVARGFEEDSLTMKKDSPTCSREAVRLTISLAASNQWTVNVLDVRSAYLQGDKIDRELFLWPPPEYNNGKLWKLNKTVYGLCDAARAWYNRVKKELLALSVQMCSLDPSLFYLKDKNNIVIGILCLYVDDFLWAGTKLFEQKVINKLITLFSISSSNSSSFKYLGLNVSSSQQGILLDQNQYLSSLQPVKVSTARAANKSSNLSENEKTEYRALIGQLNWLSTQTRPDISFETCDLHVLFKNATIDELLRLNKLINRVKVSSLEILFPQMSSISSCHIEGYADASFANLQGGKSQGGFIIFLVDTNGKRCPILWQSRAIRRVVKSTLAAETLSLVECAENGVYLSLILQELTGTKIDVKCFVDNKSLVDSIHSSKSVDDRRLRVDIAVLRDMIERKELKEVSWVPTKQQLADCLTKRGACTQQLCAALRHD